MSSLRLPLITLISGSTSSGLLVASGGMLLGRHIVRMNRTKENPLHDGSEIWQTALRPGSTWTQCWLDEGTNPNLMVDGFTPLANAAQRGDLEAVKALVEAGADVNLYDAEHPYTPLHAAAEEGHRKDRQALS